LDCNESNSYKFSLPVKWTNNIRSNYHEQDSYLLELMISTDNVSNQKLVEEINNLAEQSDYLLSNYEELV